MSKKITELNLNLMNQIVATVNAKVLEIKELKIKSSNHSEDDVRKSILLYAELVGLFQTMYQEVLYLTGDVTVILQHVQGGMSSEDISLLENMFKGTSSNISKTDENNEHNNELDFDSDLSMNLFKTPKTNNSKN